MNAKIPAKNPTTEGNKPNLLFADDICKGEKQRNNHVSNSVNAISPW